MSYFSHIFRELFKEPFFFFLSCESVFVFETLQLNVLASEPSHSIHAWQDVPHKLLTGVNISAFAEVTTGKTAGKLSELRVSSK